MKKISYFLLASLVGIFGANADTKDFKGEIRKGLRNSGGYTYSRSQNRANVVGELGHEVFYDDCPAEYDGDDEYRLFVPTSMYVRMGGGINLGFATKKARVADETYVAKDSWNVLIGLGWNLSSYVRTEVEFQHLDFKFSDLDGANAYHNTLNGMLYFDFARRYVQNGDITYRRTIVPFMGIGAGIGMYDFDGSNGAGGLTVAAPRAEFGVNFMINDIIGLDIYYQYQMLIEHGFGWNTKRIGVDNISNIMATFRMNF
ncbi:MAG: hypothetical protein J6Y07_01570 [Alphaproteobacteria bacterium]|nr:hypothetical protein [Alphaproteobacteria bacterium]